jgi:hypothetical protein
VVARRGSEVDPAVLPGGERIGPEVERTRDAAGDRAGPLRARERRRARGGAAGGDEREGGDERCDGSGSDAGPASEHAGDATRPEPDHGAALRNRHGIVAKSSRSGART